MPLFDPCPFCGKTDHGTTQSDRGATFIRCDHCGARGPRCLSAARARQAWNERAAVPKVASVLPRTRYFIQPCGRPGDSWQEVDAQRHDEVKHSTLFDTMVQHG